MKKRSERERQKRIARNARLLFGGFIAAFLITGIISNRADRKKQQQKEDFEHARTEAFAKYILNDAYSIATQKADSADIVAESNKYGMNASQTAIREMMQDLSADSTLYADAIVRDAVIINKMDPSMTFDTAMMHIARSPKYFSVCEQVSDVRQNPTHTPMGRLSTEGKIMMNKGRLQDICTELIIARRAQSIAK